MNADEKIWRYLKSAGLNDFGVAGLMGNLFAESGLNPRNLQNTYEKNLGMNDEEYTTAVDNGTYTNFVKDSAGYGLAQWTYWSRKEALLTFCKTAGASIGDIVTQLDFLVKELSEGYSGLLSTLKSASSVREASNAVLLQFERPANQGQSVQDRRANYGQTYYDKFAGTKGVKTTMGNSPLVSYTKISPNRASPRTHKIDTITIHCVVGQCTVETLGNVFAPTSKRASCNYGIGYDGKIGMYVEEKDRSWCSSSTSNDNRAITIEVASDTEHPYAVTDEAYAALIDLCEDICRRNGIKKLLWKGDKSLIGQVDKQNMTVHRWFANKACPGDYLYNRHSQIAEAVNARLENQEEDDEDMTLDKFKELMKEYRTELQDNDCGAWSQEGRDFCINNGIFVGAGTDENGQPNYMYGDFVTREQLMVVIKRLFEILDK